MALEVPCDLQGKEEGKLQREIMAQENGADPREAAQRKKGVSPWEDLDGYMDLAQDCHE